MNLPFTAALAGLCVALTVLFGWLGARPSRPLAPPRLAPWRLLMLIAFTGLVAMLVHIVTLLRDPGGAGPQAPPAGFGDRSPSSTLTTVAGPASAIPAAFRSGRI